MAEPRDVDALKRRGRRRLVGAIALVLLAIIVLPMVFEQQPRVSAPVSVQIPSVNEAGPAPQAQADTPPAAAPSPAPSSAQVSASPPAPAVAPPAPAEKPEPTAAQPASGLPAAAQTPAKTATQAPAPPPAAAPAGEEFIVPVAALAEQGRVKALTARLRSARLPYFTEAINTKNGKVTRVRVGPFTSREAAERAHAKLEKLGLKPGRVAIKS